MDGDEGIRKSLSLFFRARNCHLQTFENASQALLAIQKDPYDIILCEELLPDMNGLVFFKILNSRRNKAIKILISPYGNRTHSENIQNKDIDYLLTKPFSGDEIEAMLLKLIQSKYCKNKQA